MATIYEELKEFWPEDQASDYLIVYHTCLNYFKNDSMGGADVGNEVSKIISLIWTNHVKDKKYHKTNSQYISQILKHFGKKEAKNYQEW